VYIVLSIIVIPISIWFNPMNQVLSGTSIAEIMNDMAVFFVIVQSLNFVLLILYGFLLYGSYKLVSQQHGMSFSFGQGLLLILFGPIYLQYRLNTVSNSTVSPQVHRAIGYIEACEKQGFSDDDIRSSLVNAGYSSDVIDRALSTK
jgi:hypothetical protein